MPKRKAESSPPEGEASPPKTARQKLKEEKERAREWAHKHLKSTSAKPRALARKKATPTKKASLAARKAATASTEESSERATKRVKLNDGQAAMKLTKKEKIAQGKADALKWAQDLESRKKTTPKSKEKEMDASPSLAAATSPSPAKAKTTSPASPATLKNNSPEAPPPVQPSSGGGSSFVPQNPFTNAQQQALERAQLENAWYDYHQLQQQIAAATGSSQQRRSAQELLLRHQAMAYGQPWIPPPEYYAMPRMGMNAAPPQMESPLRNNGSDAYLRGASRNVAPSNAAFIPSPPPPQGNSAPVTSRTSMTNASSAAPATTSTAAKNAASPVTSRTAAAADQAPPPKEEHGDASVHQDDVEPEGTTKAKEFLLLPVSLKVLFLPLVVAIVAYFALLHGQHALVNVADEQVEVWLPPCFVSNPYEEDQVYENCDSAKEKLYCPNGGLCSGGELKSCVDSYRVVSETRDQCIVSAATNETLAKVEALVAGWTVEHTCSLTGCAHVVHNPDTRAPFFDVAFVKAEIDVDESLLSLSDSIVVLSGNGETIIGLTDDFLDNRLIVPMWCYIGLLAVAGFELVVSSFVYVGTWVTGLALNVTMTYPLASATFAFILWVINAIRNKRRKRKQLLQDVATVRDLTYGKLVEFNVEHFVIHLRDEVAMELYPASKSKRAYVVNTVWPRVVVDVKHDNRVLKTTKMWQGTPRDAWQWTASTTPGKK